jgi:hypothetical protein
MPSPAHAFRARRAGLAIALLAPAATATPLVAQHTRAERSQYAETSSYDDVMQFLDSLQRVAPGPLYRGALGRSVEGRVIPYMVAARPRVTSPAAARRSGRPIVYVQANIHAGEVEGKEAMQALLRDLVRDPRPNVLDSLVLLVVPIYNADGNERWGPQEQQRGSQNGPARVGQRPNADTLDLNRDYVKAEAPETRGTLALMAAWAPDVFMDLHTTNGSYHGYALTYAPSLHPAAMDGALSPAGPWTRDTLLPLLRQRMQERHGFATFDYGNFRGVDGTRDDPTRAEKGGWETYEHGARFGTNYAGVRGMVSVLSEAYSHDPFARRVAATRAFVQEALSGVAQHARVVLARVRGTGSQTRRTAGREIVPAVRPAVPLAATMTRRPSQGAVLVETLVATGDTVRHEAGLRPGFKRSGVITPVLMPVYDRFDATVHRPLPQAWVVPAAQAPLIERLRLHGITAKPLARPWRGAVQRFIVDSLRRSPRVFQRHRELSVVGRWEETEDTLPAGTWLVVPSPRAAALAAVLLEPESDDGFTTWNAFDDVLAPGQPHPVRRVVRGLPVAR